MYGRQLVGQVTWHGKGDEESHGGRQASGGWGFIILFALVEVEVVV